LLKLLDVLAYYLSALERVPLAVSDQKHEDDNEKDRRRVDGLINDPCDQDLVDPSHQSFLESEMLTQK